jgi:phytoene dehydrogenase-like protein
VSNPAPAGPFEVLVIGAGFGGLGAAIALAERGARVCLCETLRYPGGCASTFSRDGFRFDAGATLVSGLLPSQLFGASLAKYSRETVVDRMGPLVDVRAPRLRLSVTRSRQGVVDQLCAIPGAPRASIRAFFAMQNVVAEVLRSERARDGARGRGGVRAAVDVGRRVSFF